MGDDEVGARKLEEEKQLDYLKRIMNDFTTKHYGVPLTIPVELSGRLTVTWGYFRQVRVKRDGVLGGKRVRKGQMLEDKMKIVLSKRILEAKNKDVMVKIALHEALHYALYMLGRNYKDGDADFEREIRKHNLVSTSVSNESLGIKSKYYVWACSGCKRIMIAGGKTRKDYTRYVSKCCDKRLKDMGYQYLEAGQKYLK